MMQVWYIHFMDHTVRPQKKLTGPGTAPDRRPSFLTGLRLGKNTVKANASEPSRRPTEAIPRKPRAISASSSIGKRSFSIEFYERSMLWKR